MDGPGLHARYVGFRRRRAELAVDAVARRQDDLLALVDADDRRDARVKPVVSRGGLSLQALAAVDLDALHRRLLIVRVPVTRPLQYTFRSTSSARVVGFHRAAGTRKSGDVMTY